eukprot:2061502-Amphidinium_carterae.2
MAKQGRIADSGLWTRSFAEDHVLLKLSKSWHQPGLEMSGMWKQWVDTMVEKLEVLRQEKTPDAGST